MTAAAWVASKRSQLTQLMWKAAGIVRNTDDLKAALQRLAGLYVEARALSEVCLPLQAPASIVCPSSCSRRLHLMLL